MALTEAADSKICISCGALKHIDEFYLRSRSGRYRHSSCKVCSHAKTKEYQRKQYKNNPEYREREIKRSIAWYNENKNSLEFKRKNNERARKRRADRKREIIEAYGGRCACCGETEPIFLTIDHVNDDGKQHRAIVGNTTDGLYRDLKNRGFPKGEYQLLCFNCNHGRSLNNGVCPHVAN